MQPSLHLTRITDAKYCTCDPDDQNGIAGLESNLGPARECLKRKKDYSHGETACMWFTVLLCSAILNFSIEPLLLLYIHTL